MTYDPEKHHRRSIRLKGYDYTQPGAYFITICAQGRACLFGEIIDGEMHLNEAGQIVVQTWQDLLNHISNVQLDAFVVMPNHVHGIIIITDHAGGIGAGFKPARTTMGPGSVADSGSTAGPGSVGAGSVGAGSEPAPTTTTKAPGSAAGSGPTTGSGPAAGSGPTTGSGPVGAGSEPAPTAPTRSSHGLPEIVRQFKTFSARRINELRGTPGTPVWQRNYYEHIIRDEFSLSRIRQYIAENPARWDADWEHPQRPHHARRHSPPPPASQRENPTPPPPKGTPRS
jgi:putative transposase